MIKRFLPGLEFYQQIDIARLLGVSRTKEPNNPKSFTLSALIWAVVVRQ